MNWKSILATVTGIGAALVAAIGGNFAALVAHPGTILTLLLSVITGTLLGHSAGTTSATAALSPPAIPGKRVGP